MKKTKENTNKVILRLTPLMLLIIYFIVIHLYPQISYERRIDMLLAAMIIIAIALITMILKKEIKLSSILGFIPYILFIVYFIVLRLYPQISFERNMSMLFVMIVIIVISTIILIKKRSIFKSPSKRQIIMLSLALLASTIVFLTSYYYR